MQACAGAPVSYHSASSLGAPSRRARPAASFLGNSRSHLSLHATRRRQRQSVSPVAGLFGLGLPELVVIGGVVALVFGPSKLPELGKSLGKTVKSFQSAAKARAPVTALS